MEVQRQDNHNSSYVAFYRHAVSGWGGRCDLTCVRRIAIQIRNDPAGDSEDADIC